MTVRLSSLLLSAAFVGLIGVPLALFAFGVRGKPIENRAPTEVPDLSIAAMFDTGTTGQLDDYLTEALPARDDLVEFDARIDRRLGDSPNPDVIIGRDGWLFLTDTTEQPCVSEEMARTVAETLDRADRIFTAVDRRLILALGPDKASIYPEQLPRQPRCPLVTAESLAHVEVGGEFVRVWDQLRSRKSEGQLFLALDTHWSSQGASVMAEALVEQLAPGTWDEAAVQLVETRRHEGDLTVLMGLPEVEDEDRYRSVLTGLEQDTDRQPVLGVDGMQVGGLTDTRFTQVVPHPGRISGRVMVMHDSFGWAVLPLIVPYFDDVLTINQTAANPAYMSARLRASDTVVRLATQRSFYDNVVGRDLAGEYAVAFRDELAGFAPLVERSEESIRVGGIPAGRDSYVVVELGDGQDRADLIIDGREVRLRPETPVHARWVPPGGTLEITGSVRTVEVSGVSVP